MINKIEIEFINAYDKLGVGNPRHSDFSLLLQVSKQRNFITQREERVLATVYWLLFESFQRFGWWDEDARASTNVEALKDHLTDTFGPLGRFSVDTGIANAFLAISQTKAFAAKYLPLFYDSPLRSFLLPRSNWLNLVQYFPEKVSWKKGSEIVQAFRMGKRKIVRSQQFRLCRLHFPTKGSADNRPYMTYWAVTEEGLYNPNIHLKRKIERCPKNQYSTKEEVRTLWFNRFKASIDEALKTGWSPFLPDHLQPPNYRETVAEEQVLLMDMLRKELAARIETFPKSIRSLNSSVLPLLEWMESTQRSNKVLGDKSPNPTLIFTREDALAFRSYLRNDKGIKPNSINSYLSRIRAIFATFVKGKHYESNPFDDLKLSKEAVERNKPYSISQGTKVWELLEGEPELLLMTKLVYYGFMRIAEIVNLRGEHLHLGSRQIFVSKDIAKGGNEKWVALPGELAAQLKAHCKGLKPKEAVFRSWGFNKKEGDGLRYLPESFKPTEKAIRALFPGKDATWIKKAMKTKPTPLSEAAISYRYKYLLTGLGFEFNGESLYSWKHTGMISALLNGYNMAFVSNQAGHSNYNTTQLYLKRYPKGVKHDIFQAWPEEKIDQN